MMTPGIPDEVEILTDDDIKRVAEAMALEVGEVPSAEHIRLTKMIAVAINELFAVFDERLEAERNRDTSEKA